MKKAAGVCIINDKGEALFLKRSDASDYPGHFCFPGGMQDEGDDWLEDTAVRELNEETGIEVSPEDIRLLAHKEERDFSYTTFMTHVECTPDVRLCDENDEFIWATIDNLPSPLHPGLEWLLNEGAIVAMDKASVRSKTVDGRLIVEVANITKANVCPYFGKEIPKWQQIGLEPDRIYQMLRSPEELQKAVATFNDIPILSEHKLSTADAPQTEITIGTTGTEAEYAHPYIRNRLTFWSGSGIQAVESEEKKELSSSYRYDADMTPGTYEGVSYHGVMRNIRGNHVATVGDGRAGDDVSVGDSTEEFNEMAKALLSRKAAVAKGALLAYLQPIIAKDAKIDLTPLLLGVTSKNFKEKKDGIVSGLRKIVTKDVCVAAMDMDIGDAAKLLDALADTVEVEAVDATLEPNSAIPLDDTSNDSDLSFLEGKLTPEEIAKVKSMIGKTPAMDEETDEEKKAKAEKAAKDAEFEKKDKDEKDKAAMDSAIKVAVDAATKNQGEIYEARGFVRPWVGELAAAFDSANGVFGQALKNLNIKTEGVHPSAYRTILELQPKPGEKVKRNDPKAAMDSSSITDFNKRYPAAARIGNLG